MQTKLTLRLDDELIGKAKQYARRSGKSVSQIVADYFARLEKPPKTELGPVTKSLRGLLKGSRLDEADYRLHLEKKHL